jgi:hypothetical protein
MGVLCHHKHWERIGTPSGEASATGHRVGVLLQRPPPELVLVLLPRLRRGDALAAGPAGQVTRAHAAPLAAESTDVVVATGRAVHADETVFGDAALQVRTERAWDECRQPTVFARPGKEGVKVLPQHRVQRRVSRRSRATPVSPVKAPHAPAHVPGPSASGGIPQRRTPERNHAVLVANHIRLTRKPSVRVRAHAFRGPLRAGQAGGGQRKTLPVQGCPGWSHPHRAPAPGPAGIRSGSPRAPRPPGSVLAEPPHTDAPPVRCSSPRTAPERGPAGWGSAPMRAPKMWCCPVRGSSVHTTRKPAPSQATSGLVAPRLPAMTMPSRSITP